MIKVKKGLASRMWENLVRFFFSLFPFLFPLCLMCNPDLVKSALCALMEQCLAVIGEQFGAGREICGIVISVRMTEDIIAVWTRSAADRGVVLKIRSVSSLLLLIAF